MKKILVNLRVQTHFSVQVSVKYQTLPVIKLLSLYLKTMRQKNITNICLLLNWKFVFLSNFNQYSICPMKKLILFFNRQSFSNDNTFMNWQMSGACHQFNRSRELHSLFECIFPQRHNLVIPTQHELLKIDFNIILLCLKIYSFTFFHNHECLIFLEGVPCRFTFSQVIVCSSTIYRLFFQKSRP